MVRYTVQLFGITVFAMALIWFVGSGEANQVDAAKEPVLWADTFHINVDEQPDSADAALREQRRDRDTFLQDVKKLGYTALNIRNQYMEDVNTDDIIKAGIKGMLSDLDRFSVLMERSSYESLMESTHGKYEGLGMQIDSRDNRIVIISPIEGTPAYRKGLRAGDIIMEINGKDTEGMTSADASKLMRGKAGTSIDLKIKRAGLEEPIDFVLERALIELKSVNYSGVIPNTDIGYVRLSRFAEETSHELRQAISELNDENVSALVFDLRSNGGGLLDQAKETAELFLQQGREIVYTRGRFENSERHYLSERPPLFPDKPVIVLVDEGTASASEIVSGALQDWDRALILGNTTYGKGLVQQIFQIGNDGDMALKLTTAKYYVPSGRCIQKPEKQSKHPVPLDEEALDSLEAADTMAVSKDEIYYTNGGRVVYGGGGIVPDIEIERETWQPIEINLYRSGLFFNYAVDYVAKHPDVRADFVVTDDIVNDFRKYIKENDFDYTSTLEASVHKLEETVKSEEKTDLFQPIIDSLETVVEAEKTKDFDRSVDYIKRTIRREVIAAIAGQSGVYEDIVLRDDPAVKKAVKILQTPGDYTRLISQGQQKAEVTN